MATPNEFNPIFDKEFSFGDDAENTDNPSLVYIHKAGEVNDSPIYEFYFSNDPDSACGPWWENICEYNVEPPLEKYVALVARFEPEDLVLTLLEELDNFRYLDGVFGVLALGWEYVEDYTQMSNFNTELLAFRYGERLDVVQSKLKAKGLGLLLP